MQAEGSGESTHLHRLTLAFVTVPKSRVLPQMAIFVLCTGSPKPRQSTEISCAGSNGSGSALAAGSILSGFV